MMCAVLMEDLPEYCVLRKELIASCVDKVALQRVAEHIGTIHNATHVSTLAKHDFDSLLQQYKSVLTCYSHLVTCAVSTCSD